MTSRLTTLIFIALLAFASLAGADTPAAAVPETTLLPAAALSSPAAPDEASADCNPLLATLESTASASAYPACGRCSVSACQFRSIYDVCGGTLTQPKRCKTSGSMCLDPENPGVKCLCVDWITP